MVFVGDHNNAPLSEALSKKISVPIIYPEITVFSDGEKRVVIPNDVKGQDVVFLSTSQDILTTAFIIDALKRNKAQKITGIIPYFPYSRADHVTVDGEALGAGVIVKLLESVGLDNIILIDPHSKKLTDLFSIPIKELSTAKLFANKIEEIGFDKDSILVSPDSGGLSRIIEVSKLLDNAPYVSLEKKRDHKTGDIISSILEQDIKSRCFLIDDMITSGGTVIKAVEQLKKKGAKKIYVFAIHGIFSGNASQLLQDAEIKNVYITNSVPIDREKEFPKLEVLALDAIFGKVI